MKAAVIGLGVEGKKAVNSLLNHGWDVYATDLNSKVDLSDLELPMISMNLVSGDETVSIVSDNLTVDLGFSNSHAIEECDAIAISPSMYGGAFANTAARRPEADQRRGGRCGAGVFILALRRHTVPGGQCPAAVCGKIRAGSCQPAAAGAAAEAGSPPAAGS